MANYKDILYNNNQDLSNEELLKYLDEKTTEEEKYTIEKKIINASFENDALDGLQKLKDSKSVQKHVNLLHNKLHQQLHPKKQRQKKGKIKDFQWIILTVLLLLFISLIGYGLIVMFQ